MYELGEQTSYVGGRYLASTTDQAFESVNPATGKPIARIEVAGEREIQRAVEDAQEGFRSWSAMKGAERGRILMRAVGLIRERKDALARLEVLDTGKPIFEARSVDIDSGADCLEYFAGLAAGIQGDCVDLDHAFVYTRREPLGVCVGIGAWNYPFQIACWKAAPALAAGNAMIFKPAELTPLSALKLAEILTEAGVPNGVFNVVQGFADTGRLLVRHPHVAKVSLTGEVATGKKVMVDAAQTLKHLTMELGGKSPLIVFRDADLDDAVAAAMLGNFFTQGEVCTNATRVFVEESIAAAFMDRLLERTRKLRIGNPMDPQTQVGALISEEHLESVLSYIETGKREGAELVMGGGRPSDATLAGGFFVEPTIFDRCRDEMTIVREEIFGPVMSVLTFTDEGEVIARANDTPYGLAAGVFTRDLARAHRVIARLQAGTCWINNYNVTPIEMPTGGYKQSGFGRENGFAAIEHYTQLKSVYVELGHVEAPY